MGKDKDIRSYALSYRDPKNVGNPAKRSTELKEKLRLAIQYLRDGRPMDTGLRIAIAELIENFAFPKKGPKGSSIDFIEFGYRVDELEAELEADRKKDEADGKKVGKKVKVGEIDKKLAKEFSVGDEDDQSTVKRLRLKWKRVRETLDEIENKLEDEVREMLNEFNNEWREKPKELDEE